MTFGVLFEESPSQWGLRGDPYLWQEMRRILEKRLLPMSEEEVKGLLENTYEQITGSSLAESQPIFIERFNHGGMSGGGISPQFWREHIIPLVLERFRMLK